MNQDKVRVLRIVEYSGDREAVERLVRESIHGEKSLTNYCKLGNIVIKAATIGLYPEILKSETDEEKLDDLLKVLETNKDDLPIEVLHYYRLIKPSQTK